MRCNVGTNACVPQWYGLLMSQPSQQALEAKRQQAEQEEGAEELALILLKQAAVDHVGLAEKIVTSVTVSNPHVVPLGGRGDTL